MGKRIVSAVLALVMLLCLLPAGAIRVQAASAMTGSEDILNYIKTMEGFIAVPQWDIAQWTVGYGTKCPDEDLERYLEEGIPLDEAEELFRKYIAIFEGYVNRFIDDNNLTLNQNQFDAILSLSYNCGISWMYNNSSLYKAIVGGATGNSLIGVMSQYCTAGGSYLGGLMRRRLTEANIYLNGVYSAEIPDSYCYVFFDAGSGKASAVAQGYDTNLYAEPLVTAKRDGYTFVGWYTSATGGMKVSYLDENMDGMTLYAHWQQGSGSVDEPDGTVIDAVLVTVTGDIVNVRSGPGISYSAVGSVTAGTKLAITEVTLTGSRLWGKFDKGWICLEYTNYEEVIAGTDAPSIGDEVEAEDSFVVPDLPIFARILGTKTLSVYNGPHSSYPVIDTLSEGERVVIVEMYKMFSTWWCRIEGSGWVKLNLYVMLEDAQALAHSVVVTVTNYNLNVRADAGADKTWLSSLKRGDQIEIYAVKILDGVVWGRCSPGWVCLQYTDFDDSKLDQYWYHSYGNWYTSQEATCVENGMERRDCQYCSDYETRATDVVDHSYGQWYVTLEPTCVEKGAERRDCQVCGVSEVREVALADHSYGQWYVVEAGTCVTKGIERRDCQHCDVWEERETEHLAHSFGQWFEETAATCEEDGVNRRECEFCDAYEQEVIPATGHSMGQWYETLTPTLTEYGEERRDCQRCDYFEVREVEPSEHLFGDWYVFAEPTCTGAGEERRDCTECDFYQSRTLEALGHNFGDWQQITESTCTEAGQALRICRECAHYEIREDELKEHNFGDWYIVEIGNCEEGSVKCRGCRDCGYLETVIGEPGEHVFGEWYVFAEPTCISAGENRRVCAECGHYETESIDMVDHSLGQWYTAREPSCSAEGLERRDCQWCDYYESNALAMLAHSYGEWYVSVEATYTTPGEERRDCTNCNAYMVRQTDIKMDTALVTYATITYEKLNVRSGPGTGYARVGVLYYGDRVKILSQTTVGNAVWGQFEDGWICLTGYTRLETVEEQVEHTHVFGEWYTVVEATTTENGQERRDCTLCDHCEVRETEKLPTTVTKVYGTLTGHHRLNIRASATTNSAKLGELKYGDRVEILEQVTISGNVWGRIEQGWILITGYMTLETVEESIEHTHVFGEWYTVVEATTTENGQERRDCTLCDHYEERETEKLVETVTKVYGTLTGYTFLNIRESASSVSDKVGELQYGDCVEILEMVTVNGNVWGRIEQGWIMITGYMTLETVEEPVEHTHTYGEWYTVVEATTTENGQERRDCTICDHYEVRETEKLPATVTKVYGTLTGYTFLNIRESASSSSAKVGELKYGDRVEILEQVTVNGNVWGRIEQGWIMITGYMTLETVEETQQESERVFMTVNTSLLNVRSGAGAHYDLVTTLIYGTQVEVLEVVYINGTAWARIPLGWVCMAYLL